VILYRVFPYLASAEEGEPGHPLYIPTPQGNGRWDNPALYHIRYFAISAEAAVGEAFANFSTWTPVMLSFPQIPGAERVIGTFLFDEEKHPLLDLDDAENLAARNMKPTSVVRRNRAASEEIARRIFEEGKWAGIQWWSFHRPQWPLVALWNEGISFHSAVSIRGHAALTDAASTLYKKLEGF
jgi:hypothetical protein